MRFQSIFSQLNKINNRLIHEMSVIFIISARIEYDFIQHPVENKQLKIKYVM